MFNHWSRDNESIVFPFKCKTDSVCLWRRSEWVWGTYFTFNYKGYSKTSKPCPDLWFLQSLNFCMNFAFPEIKTEICSSFSSFIRSGSMLP